MGVSRFFSLYCLCPLALQDHLTHNLYSIILASLKHPFRIDCRNLSDHLYLVEKILSWELLAWNLWKRSIAERRLETSLTVESIASPTLVHSVSMKLLLALLRRIFCSTLAPTRRMATCPRDRVLLALPSTCCSNAVITPSFQLPSTSIGANPGRCHAGPIYLYVLPNCRLLGRPSSTRH